MAKFGQGFLQALTQPSYGQGLFQLGETLGATPGRLARLEKMKQAGPVDLAQMGVDQAMRSGDPTAVMRAQQNKRSIVQQRTRSSLNGLELARQKAMEEGDDAKAKEIEDIMERVATAGELSNAEVRGINGRTASEVNAREEAKWQAQSRAAQAQKAEQTAMVEQAAGQIAASGENINEAVDKLPDEVFTPAMKNDLLKQAGELRDLREKNDEAMRDGELTRWHKAYLKDHPEILDSPQLREQRDILLAETSNPGQKRRAVKLIADAVNNHFKEQRELDKSKENREFLAGQAVDFVSGMESVTNFWRGQDLVEYINDEYPIGSEERKDLEKAIAFQMARDPKLMQNAENAVRAGLERLGEEGGINQVGEGRRQAAQEAKVEKARLREAAIQQKIKEGMSRSEAEAFITKAEQGVYRARTTQGM